jgi:hypothetical protein
MEIKLKENASGTLCTEIIPKCINLKSKDFLLLILRRCSYVDYTALNGCVTDRRWIRKDLESSGCGLIGVLSRYVPNVTKENSENHQIGQPVPRSRFEPSSSGIRVWSVAAMPTRSVIPRKIWYVT